MPLCATLPPLPAATTQAAQEAQCLNDRLIEIRDMDKTHMPPNQKKELRKEVRSIKEQLKMNNGGIYLSIGAIIIIILLLILLL